MPISSFPAQITAVLGSTNTGKTHYAVERMLARASGVIGLPLRLLAREVYDKAVKLKGAAACALITGEEKIIPKYASYFICTAEAMPMPDILAGKFACVVIDEVQMMSHKERGYIFTDRVMRARGTEETLLLGAQTARPVIERLVPAARFVTRERFSNLSYAGHKKLTRLPKRSVIVAFTTEDVYSIAELVKRQFGGAALVMGGLSPRTRNAQARLYQEGEVDYLVATDAIGMGLNLDADHVAFASVRKFDGQRRRYLYAFEAGQIAGRAGRFRNDGTFGSTGKCLPFDDDFVERICNHDFESLRSALWRPAQISTQSLEALLDSLAAHAPNKTLRRIAPPLDELVLDRLIKTHDVTDSATSPQQVKTLWDVCQIPDFRNVGVEAHARFTSDLYNRILANNGTVPNDYFERNVKRLDIIHGSVDMLSARLAAIRTWTFIANKAIWGHKSKGWAEVARTIENKLSDELHERLVLRFVDRRTSALLKGLGEHKRMEATINKDGEVFAEGHKIGHLSGLLFTPDDAVDQQNLKIVQSSAAIALAPEIDKRLIQITGSDNTALVLRDDGLIYWVGTPIAKLVIGANLLTPQIALIGGDLGSPVLCDQAAGRVRDYLRLEIQQKLEALVSLNDFATDPQSYPGSRALAALLHENYGNILRGHHYQLIKDVDKISRGHLRAKSVKFGFYHIFLMDLMKPKPARLLSILFAHAWDKDGGGHGKPFLPPNGMASTPDNDKTINEATLNKAGYTRCGPRVVRFDILSRLAEMIIQAKNAFDNKRFRIAQEMMALLGCGYEDLEGVLTALGYKKISHPLEGDALEAEQREARALFERVQDAQRPAAETPLVAEPQDQQAPVTQSAPAGSETFEPAAQTTNPDLAPQTPESSETSDGEAGSTPAPAPKTAEPYVPKRQRVKPIHDYRPKPELDPQGVLLLPTHIDVWEKLPKVHFNPKRAEHAPSDKNKNKSRNDKTGFRGKPKRSGNKPGDKQPRQNKQLTPARPINPEDSPFAALAGLNLSGTKKRNNDARHKNAKKKGK